MKEILKIFKKSRVHRVKLHSTYVLKSLTRLVFGLWQENNSFDNLNSTQDDIQIETEGSISAVPVFSASSSANLIVPKTARDKFFIDLQYEIEKKR